MRVPHFKIVMMFLVMGLMLWHPKAAEAHGIAGTSHYTAHQNQEGLPLKASSASAEVRSVISNAQDDDNCDGNCCALGHLCCGASGMLTPASPEISMRVAGFASAFSPQSPPEEPASALLRPPKFSA